LAKSIFLYVRVSRLRFLVLKNALFTEKVVKSHLSLETELMDKTISRCCPLTKEYMMKP
jgi:hypothetical protein